MKREDIHANASLSGILPDAMVKVVSVQWFGSEALELTYKTADRRVGELSYQVNADSAQMEVGGGRIVGRALACPDGFKPILQPHPTCK